MGIHTWNASLEQWRSELAASGRPTTTIELRLYHLRRFAKETGAKTPWQVERADLVRWLASHEWSRETARSYRASLRVFYSWAVDMGYITISPAATLPPIKPSEPNPTPTPHDMWRKALDDADDDLVVALRLAGEAGLRRAEIAQIHGGNDLREEITRNGLGWSLRVHGKGGKVAWQPISDELARAIQSQAGNGWLFPGAIDGHISPRWLGKRISRLFPRGLSTHNLRHKAASDTYDITGDIYVVMAMLRHAQIQTSLIYTPKPIDKVRTVTNLLAERRYVTGNQLSKGAQAEHAA